MSIRALFLLRSEGGGIVWLSYLVGGDAARADKLWGSAAEIERNQTMSDWWSSLESANKVFYALACFFSAIFVWQFLSSLIGLAGEADVDVEVDADIDVDGIDLDSVESAGIEEAGESVASFKMLSLRAILAFCTLFSWATAMYRNSGVAWTRTLLYATFWGLAGWIMVALLVWLIRKLAETGNPRVATCVGTEGTVYLDIPAEGFGEVRAVVSGVVSRVKARSVGSEAIPSGKRIKIIRALDPTTVEVQPVE